MNYKKIFFCLFRNRAVLLLFAFLLSIPMLAQIDTKELGSWTMFVSQVRVHSKFSIHAEAQFRSYDVKPNTEQVLARGGLNYHYNPNIIFSAGYGYILNFADDGDVFKPHTVRENRVWQQIALRSSTGRLFIEHRYRLEQRWISANNQETYRNRIRYLLRATIPLNKKEVVKNTAFLTFYDEIFIHINNTPFDRNRLYGALGFQFSPSLNIQAGYLIQTVGTGSKQFLQLGINYNPDLRKK